MLPSSPSVARPPFTDQAILVTGGTGSFGASFIAYLLREHQPKKVVCFSRDELKQSEMAARIQDPRVRFWLGDVRDRDRLTQAFQGINIVIHAAALKRVDAIAYNPGEVQKTNVIGTQNVCMAAIEADVHTVVMLSSDKAVHPTNIYGSSKQFGEYLALQSNVYGVPRETQIVVVRYGNVMASRGSVVGIFRAARDAGRPIPITDPTMTRFWLTLPAAHEIVRQAVTDLYAGEILVPKLPALTIADLAEAIAPGHPTVVVGRRSGGEKLHERLLSDEEVLRATDCGLYYVIRPDPHPWTRFERPGPVLPSTFLYDSATARRLSVADIRALLESVT